MAPLSHLICDPHTVFTIAQCLCLTFALVGVSRHFGERLPTWATLLLAVCGFALMQATLLCQQVSSVIGATICVLGCELGALALSVRAVLALLSAHDRPDDPDEGGDDDGGDDDGPAGDDDPLERLWRLPERQPLVPA
jgi:hypothetical protein